MDFKALEKEVRVQGYAQFRQRRQHVNKVETKVELLLM